jgi:hypothetical protein
LVSVPTWRQPGDNLATTCRFPHVWRCPVGGAQFHASVPTWRQNMEALKRSTEATRSRVDDDDDAHFCNFREHSVNFREHSVNFREHSVNCREHSVNFREHSVHFRMNISLSGHKAVGDLSGVSVDVFRSTTLAPRRVDGRRHMRAFRF